mgnify:FL=1
MNVNPTVALKIHLKISAWKILYMSVKVPMYAVQFVAERKKEQSKRWAGFEPANMLTEDEQMELAIKQSLIESGISTSPIPSPLKQAVDPGQLMHYNNNIGSPKPEEKMLFTSYTQGLRGGCRDDHSGLRGGCKESKTTPGDPCPRLNDSLIISCDEESLMSDMGGVSQGPPGSPIVSTKRKSTNSAAFLISSDEDEPAPSLKTPPSKKKTPADRNSGGKSDSRPLVQMKLTSPRLAVSSGKKRRRIIRTPTKDSPTASSTVTVMPTVVGMNSDGILTIKKNNIRNLRVASDEQTTSNERITANEGAEARLRSNSLCDDEDGLDQVVPDSQGSVADFGDGDACKGNFHIQQRCVLA